MRTVPLAFILLWSTLAWADFTIEQYIRFKDSPDVGKQLNDYITGTGRGVFWANAFLKAQNKPALFCLPPKLTLDEGIIHSVLDQELRDAAPPYKTGTPIELVMVQALVNHFPCN